MDKETAIKKIRKCMALAKSSEPHEAAAALRQAQKLMEQFGIDNPEVLAAGISEEWGKSASKKTPTQYEVNLASMVCHVFNCDLIFSRRLSKTGMAIDGGYSFIGTVPAPEIAAYTFAVLRRQISKARKEYISTALKRHRKNKTSAADEFCIGWVMAAKSQISEMVRTPEQDEAMAAYKRINYGEISTRDARHKSAGKKAAEHVSNGWIEGKKANVHKAMDTSSNLQLGM